MIQSQQSSKASAKTNGRPRSLPVLERKSSWLSECASISESTERSILVVRDGIVVERQLGECTENGDNDSYPIEAESPFSHSSSLASYFKSKQASSGFSERYQKEANPPSLPAVNLMDPSTWMMLDDGESQQQKAAKKPLLKSSWTRRPAYDISAEDSDNKTCPVEPKKPSSDSSLSGSCFPFRQTASCCSERHWKKKASTPALPPINLMDPSTWMMLEDEEDRKEKASKKHNFNPISARRCAC